jgi:omega-hydroxy-beta-dihydromenaquinone-9 sulfotransferase
MSLGINTKASAEKARRSETGKALKRVDRPIFITGLGRSGTTIIHTLLSKHPNTSWTSLLVAKFPARLYFNRWLLRAMDIPLLNIYLKWRFVPLENYSFWDHYYGGFGYPGRDLFASDVDVTTAKSIRKAFSELVTRKKNRVLIKITGAPRISFLHEIFPDAKFIHVTRDGRAVVASRMKAAFWNGWRGWRGFSLWPERMPAQYEEEWERHRYSFVALAGIEWKAHIDQMNEVRRDYPHINIMEVRYESFCDDPVGQLRKIAKFCELDWTKTFENRMKREYVSSENSKWRSQFTPEQRTILQDVLAEQLVEQGYELEEHAVVSVAPADANLSTVDNG